MAPGSGLLLLPCSRQVVLQAVELATLLLPFAAAAVVLGRRRVVDVKGLLVLQAGFQGVLQLVGSAGVILPGEMGGVRMTVAGNIVAMGGGDLQWD